MGDAFPKVKVSQSKTAENTLNRKIGKSDNV